MKDHVRQLKKTNDENLANNSGKFSYQLGIENDVSRSSALRYKKNKRHPYNPYK